MGEVKTIVYGESFQYKGLMNVKEIYKLVDKWFTEHNYDKQELWNFEEIYEDGKQITMKIQPYKKISDYAKIEHRITFEFKKIKDVVIEKNKVKHKLQQGEVKVIFDLFLNTDYEHSWENNPVYFFFKLISERFLYRSYLEKYEEQAVGDKEEVKRELKSYLNMQRFV